MKQDDPGFSVAKAQEILDTAYGPDGLGDRDGEVYRVGVVLLTRMNRRKDVFNTWRMTGYDRAWLAKVRKNLVASGIWGKHMADKATYLEDHENMDVVFLLAMMCGAGLVERHPAEEKITDTGLVPKP